MGSNIIFLRLCTQISKF